MSSEKAVNHKKTSGNTISPWLLEKQLECNSLKKDHETEICIVGAGMAGLSVAYQLVLMGNKVTVLDAGEIGSGETGRTTAHLTNAFDDRYYNLSSLEERQLIAQSHTQAIDYIEQIIKKEKIKCDFSRLEGYLFLGENDPVSLLEKELQSAHEAGLKDISLIEKTNLKGFPHTTALCFPQQAQFHPMKYLNGLAKAIIKQGGKIFTNTAVVKIEGKRKLKIKTQSNNVIEASKVVIATNAPIYDNSYTFAKQNSQRSYVIAAIIPKGSIYPALYWDTEQPYHYIRIQPWNDKEELLIVGGEDHRTGKNPSNASAPFIELEKWSHARFPQIKEVIFKWSGQIQEPNDYKASIGQLSGDYKNVFIATGDSGNGMTHGAIAGMLLGDLIMHKANPWEQLYSPQRSSLKNIKNLLAHNLQSALSYAHYLTPGDVKNISEIKNGEGAVLNEGIQKIAVYRDERGKVCEHLAVCTHMGAPLKWNEVEKSWDCPAHGSRFSACGEVIQGPASTPLKKKK